MTYLQSKPFADRRYDSVTALAVDLRNDHTQPARGPEPRYELPESHRAANAVLYGDDDLALELARLTPRYFDARETFEETSDPTPQAAREYATAGAALVHVLVTIGAYETDTAAAAAVQAFTFPFGSFKFVSRWVYKEGLDTVLGSGEIARISMAVEDRIAAGDSLDDLPMWELADPHLTGGDL